MPVIRLLLDNNVPLRLIPLLRPREAVHASRVGWAELANGELLRAADEHGFHLLHHGRPKPSLPAKSDARRMLDH
jgi:hypothetical protein